LKKDHFQVRLSAKAKALDLYLFFTSFISFTSIAILYHPFGI